MVWGPNGGCDVGSRWLNDVGTGSYVVWGPSGGSDVGSRRLNDVGRG